MRRHPAAKGNLKKRKHGWFHRGMYTQEPVPEVPLDHQSNLHQLEEHGHTFLSWGKGLAVGAQDEWASREPAAVFLVLATWKKYFGYAPMELMEPRI